MFAIYASPRLAERKILWNNLKTVAHLHNLPSLMLGDFNEILCGEDKFGGNHVNLNRALEFKNCLDECNMLDLGFAGPKFTWTNRRPISNLILERIDQCFTNLVWRMLFPKALVTHLPMTFSDHCPILIELCKANVNQQNKPFRFQTMWLFHQDFPTVVQQAWSEDRDLQEATLDFVVRAKKWNCEVFRNLFAKKKRILARLHGTQKALTNNSSEFLLELEQQLISEYPLSLMQEEEYWALKSRLNTATFGDRNTSFFHISTLVRRHRNKIRCIKDRKGNWLIDEIVIKDHIQDGFKKLYRTELEVIPINSNVSRFSCCFLE